MMFPKPSLYLVCMELDELDSEFIEITNYSSFFFEFHEL